MKKFYSIFVLSLFIFPFASIAGSENKTNIPTTTPDSSECYAAQKVTVCGVVYGYYYNPKISGGPTFLDMGAPYPKSTFTVLIGEDDLPKFNYDVQTIVNNDVCFTGVVTVYNNRPEMIITDPMQITLHEQPVVASIGKKHKKNKL